MLPQIALAFESLARGQVRAGRTNNWGTSGRKNQPRRIQPAILSPLDSTSVSQRDESQNVPSPEELFKTRDLQLPLFFDRSLPGCWPHSTGYTRTFLHPYFPFGNSVRKITYLRNRPLLCPLQDPKTVKVTLRLETYNLNHAIGD